MRRLVPLLLVAAASVGAQTPIGIETRVNTSPIYLAYNGDVATTPDGRSVAVWMSDQQDGDGYGVYGRVYGSDGTPVGAAFQVNSETAGDQSFPTVGMADDGRFVVVWSSAPISSLGSKVMVRRFRADGTPVDPEVEVGTAGTTRRNPDVAVGPDGQFLVAYEEEQGDTDPVLSVSYSASGEALSAPTRVFGLDSRSMFEPSVAARRDGRYVVAVRSETFSAVTNVRLRLVSATGTPEGSAVRFDSASNEGYTNYAKPTVVVDGGGRTVVVYSRGVSQIQLRAFTSTLAPVGTPLIVAPVGGHQYTDLHVAENAGGGLAIAWEEYDASDPAAKDIWLRAYAPDFSALGPAVRANTFTLGNQSSPRVALDGSGRAWVTWESANQDGFQGGIYSQRYADLAVAAEDVPALGADVTVTPNPVGPSGASVHFVLDTPAEVRLVLADVLGREVRVLTEGARLAGAHTVRLETRGLPAGVYVVRIAAGLRIRAQRLTVVR